MSVLGILGIGLEFILNAITVLIALGSGLVAYRMNDVASLVLCVLFSILAVIQVGILFRSAAAVWGPWGGITAVLLVGLAVAVIWRLLGARRQPQQPS